MIFFQSEREYFRVEFCQNSGAITTSLLSSVTTIFYHEITSAMTIKEREEGRLFNMERRMKRKRACFFSITSFDDIQDFLLSMEQSRIKYGI